VPAPARRGTRVGVRAPSKAPGSPATTSSVITRTTLTARSLEAVRPTTIAWMQGGAAEGVAEWRYRLGGGGGRHRGHRVVDARAPAPADIVDDDLAAKMRVGFDKGIRDTLGGSRRAPKAASGPTSRGPSSCVLPLGASASPVLRSTCHRNHEVVRRSDWVEHRCPSTAQWVSVGSPPARRVPCPWCRRVVRGPGGPVVPVVRVGSGRTDEHHRGPAVEARRSMMSASHRSQHVEAAVRTVLRGQVGEPATLRSHHRELGHRGTASRRST